MWVCVCGYPFVSLAGCLSAYVNSFLSREELTVYRQGTALIRNFILADLRGDLEQKIVCNLIEIRVSCWTRLSVIHQPKNKKKMRV